MSVHVDELRAVVAAMSPAPEVMAAYLAKVRDCAYKITDGDVQALEDAGVDEDTIFEQTVAVAISEGLRRLDAATRAIG